MAEKHRTVRSRSRERRSEARVATIYRPVLIATNDFTGLCLVRNLSPNGMMCDIYTHLPKGMPLTLSFTPEIVVHGIVLWSSGGRIGVQLNHELDVGATLAHLGPTIVSGKINRPLRLEIPCNGTVIVGDRALDFTLKDISQRGIKARTPFIHPGHQVEVDLPGIERRKAIVRWSQDGFSGLNFLRPLPFEELAQWVIERNADGSRVNGFSIQGSYATSLIMNQS